MSPYQWFKGLYRSFGVGAILLAIVAVCALFSATVFVIQSRINNAIVQPQERQNLDQNANYRRSVEAQFTAAYADYQNELDAVKLDQDNLDAFIAQNGKPADYPPYSQVADEYQQLFQAWSQDRQALVNAVTDYDALCTNTDTGPYRPGNLPASLSVPTPEPAATP